MIMQAPAVTLLQATQNLSLRHIVILPLSSFNLNNINTKQCRFPSPPFPRP